jgi:hypothetical protein
MRYRKLTPSGDYSFGNGQQDFYRDVPEAVAQAVKTRLLLWLGEWFLDTDQGTPYMQGILGKHPLSVADATIRDRAQGTQGMVGIKNYESVINPDSRLLSVQFDIDTIYGPTEVDLENYDNY